MDEKQPILPTYIETWNKEDLEAFDLVFAVWWYKLWLKFKRYIKNAKAH